MVVDWEGNAIRGFKNIPVCISSNVEGWRIESWMRADARLRMSDLVARIRARATPGGRVPVYTHTTLTKRSQLFRQKSALITWGPTHPKPTTKANMDFVNAIRRAEMTPAQFASNLALPRDLTDDEHAQLLHLTKKPGSVSRTANAAATKAARSAAQSSNTKTTRSKRTATTATATPPASRAANVDSSQKGRRVTTRSITKAAGGAADVRSSQWQHMVPATSAFQSSNYAAKTGRRQANHVLPATPFIISVRNAAYADSSQGHRGVTAITSARSSDLFPNTHNNRGNPDLSFLGDPFISYAEFVADYYEGRIPDQYL